MRCPICRELLLSGSKITACGHTFCGECIERHLNSSENCPVCRVSVQRSQLRVNQTVANLVEEWQFLRSSLLDALKPRAGTPADSADSAHPINISPPDSTSAGTTSTCPICLKQMPIEEIETTHLDSCLHTPFKPKRRFLGPPPPSKRIAWPIFGSLTDIKLRTLLSGHQLSTKGNRSRLKQRLTEYITLYNTNLDSKEPLSVPELRRRMNTWEKIQDSSPAALSSLDATSWTKEHKNDFDDLIEKARKSRNKTKTETNKEQ